MWRWNWRPTQASVGQTITQYQTEALPLVSRNYSDLLALVTGFTASTHLRYDQLDQQPGSSGFL